MNTYINTLSLLLSYVHFSMPSGVIRTGKYKRIEGLSFIEVAVFETKTFRYIPFCISYCDDVIQCNSVAWDGQTGSCQLSGADITHERNVHELMNSSIGWTAAVKIRYKVFNRQGALRYSLTFPDAIKECLDNGYVIADEADMIEARDTGFYECVCGWISDGSIRLILQQNEPGCWYVYTDGYEDCSTDLEGLADVWCKWED